MGNNSKCDTQQWVEKAQLTWALIWLGNQNLSVLQLERKTNKQTLNLQVKLNKYVASTYRVKKKRGEKGILLSLNCSNWDFFFQIRL